MYGSLCWQLLSKTSKRIMKFGKKVDMSMPIQSKHDYETKTTEWLIKEAAARIPMSNNWREKALERIRENEDNEMKNILIMNLQRLDEFGVP
jgi:hypothetical protein